MVTNLFVFPESEASLPRSQEVATGPYPNQEDKAHILSYSVYIQSRNLFQTKMGISNDIYSIVR
jgi:hypothetical protein